MAQCEGPCTYLAHQELESIKSSGLLSSLYHCEGLRSSAQQSFIVNTSEDISPHLTVWPKPNFSMMDLNDGLE